MFKHVKPVLNTPNISQTRVRVKPSLNESEVDSVIAVDNDISNSKHVLNTKETNTYTDKTSERIEHLNKIKTNLVEVIKPDTDLHIPKQESKVRETDVRQKNVNEIQVDPYIIEVEDPEITVTNQNKSIKERVSDEVNDLKEVIPTEGAMLDNTDDTGSLLIPLLSLSLVLIVILALASIRGLYSMYVKRKEAQDRSRSTSRTLDSRRSSTSRSSEESMYSSRRMRRKAREMEIEKERMMIYDEIMHKTRLSPLIEVIEPTPPMQRNSPIFMMTSLDMLGISDESE